MLKPWEYLFKTHMVLKKKFPDRVRDMYVDYVRKHAESVCDRKAYKGLMAYMKKAAKYSGGKEIADQIAKEWKVIKISFP